MESSDTHGAFTGVQDLEAVLKFIRPIVDNGFDYADEDLDAAAAVIGLLHTMFVHANAMLVLAKADLAEASTANARTMFEAWMQLVYLLKCTDSREGGLKYRAFALLELRDYVQSGEDSEDVVAIDEEIAAFAADHPALLTAIRRLRGGGQGNRLYWTGLGPTALIEQVAPVLGDTGALRRFYKFSSWDLHHTMTPALNVRRVRTASGVGLEFGPRQDPAEAAHFECSIAARMLASAWELATETLLKPRER